MPDEVLPDDVSPDAIPVLLWLNDRLGKCVAAEIDIERGDFKFSVFEAQGELRHWSTETGTEQPASRDDMLGYYEVGGGAKLDLTNVRPLEVTTGREDLIVRLDENTTLEVVEQGDI